MFLTLLTTVHSFSSILVKMKPVLSPNPDLRMLLSRRIHIAESISDLRCSALPAPSVFLREMMSSRTPQLTKSNLMSSIQSVRKSDEQLAFKFMDQVVTEIEKISDNPVAMMKWPIDLPSYRLKLGCFKRMVDDMVQDEPTDMRRRRSAVSQLLRQLEEKSGIRKLEREYERKKKSECTMEEMLARTPPDLETPQYDVIVRREKWEVREYKDFSVCSFRMEGQTGGSAFNALAGYIFGKNQVCFAGTDLTAWFRLSVARQESVKMAMTTPVISSGGGSKMSFVLPSSYWTDVSRAPRPVPSAGTFSNDNPAQFNYTSIL
jgi:hypothetical protein